jgi:hypothetical protein
MAWCVVKAQRLGIRKHVLEAAVGDTCLARLPPARIQQFGMPRDEGLAQARV